MEEKDWVQSLKNDIAPVLAACDALAASIADGKLTKAEVAPQFQALEKQLDLVSASIKERRAGILDESA